LLSWRISGAAVVVALSAYYGAASGDPSLWALVVSAVGALVTEATAMAVEHVAWEKEVTAQMAEKTV
jgi:hypothetical protein